MPNKTTFLDENPTGCCPKFNVKDWDQSQVTWDKKMFIQEDLPQIFHMPLPWMIGKMITRMQKKAEDAGAAAKLKDFLWLAYDPSPWKSENYIHVTKKVPSAKNVTLSGTFLTKVFDGPYNDAPKWFRQMEKYVESKGKKIKKAYFFYTTCPKCAKVYGHNYTVLLAQI